MKYLGNISNPKDLVTKEYVDGNVGKIFYGEVDSTSTSTAFTATISGITSYFDGLTILLKNGVATSAANFTIDINGLGGKGSYSNMATGNPTTPTAPTRDTTIFNINYTMMFVYSSTLVSGGCWIGYRGYNSDTNTIAYNVRRGQTDYVTNTALYRYQICFTMSNGKLLPANTSSNTTGTSKTLTTTAFDPFQPIFYYGTTTTVSSGSSPSSSYMWYSNVSVDLRYAFNTGKTLTSKTPVYIRLAPQSDGTAKLDGNNCIVQALPSTEDNKLYLYLGRSYSDYQISLDIVHPIYYYKDGAIRLWTNSSAVSVPVASDSTPAALGTASAGSSAEYSRADHVHAKPTYSASDVGLGNVDNVQQYSASNPPPYPVTSVNGSTGAVTVSVPSKVSDLTNDSGFITGMYIASYGTSTYADILAAYQANKIIYCRASSDTNPSSGEKKRLAFLAYVNYETTPTEFEFQYYRSVSTHTDAQQGDQVFVYKVNSGSVWSVTVREAYTKIATGTGLSKSYSNGTLTISNSQAALPTVSASDNGKVLMVVNGAWAAASLPVYNGGVS